MKINWGTGITIGIILFITFILTMVFKMVSTNADLYAKDYYEQEVGFQDRINSKKNMNSLSGTFDINTETEVITIVFPSDFDSKNVSGTISLYRPNNAKLDRSYTIKLVNNTQVIPKDKIVLGNYTLKVDCQVDNTPYFYQKDITIR